MTAEVRLGTIDLHVGQENERMALPQHQWTLLSGGLLLCEFGHCLWSMPSTNVPTVKLLQIPHT